MSTLFAWVKKNLLSDPVDEQAELLKSVCAGCELCSFMTAHGRRPKPIANGVPRPPCVCSISGVKREMCPNMQDEPPSYTCEECGTHDIRNHRPVARRPGFDPPPIPPSNSEGSLHQHCSVCNDYVFEHNLNLHLEAHRKAGHIK